MGTIEDYAKYRMITNDDSSDQYDDEEYDYENECYDNQLDEFDDSYVESMDFDFMDGQQFEKFCADILKENGYSNVSVTKGSGDQGIDVIAHRSGVKYGIQCKCYSGAVGNSAIMEAFSGKAFYNCHVAVVLTNSYFTKSAIELAEKNGVVLWDRDTLLELVEPVKDRYIHKKRNTVQSFSQVSEKNNEQQLESRAELLKKKEAECNTYWQQIEIAEKLIKKSNLLITCFAILVLIFAGALGYLVNYSIKGVPNLIGCYIIAIIIGGIILAMLISYINGRKEQINALESAKNNYEKCSAEIQEMKGQ